MRAILWSCSLVSLVACGSADGVPEPQTKPQAARLVILSDRPLVVRGTGFQGGERVKLLVTVDGRVTRGGAARASTAGRFVVRLRASAGVRDGLVVQAIGNRGSRAMADILAPTGPLAPAP